MYYDLSNMTFFQKIKFWLYGFSLMYRAYICATRFDCKPQYCKYCDRNRDDCCVCHSAYAMELADVWNYEYVQHGGKFRSNERND